MVEVGVMQIQSGHNCMQLQIEGQIIESMHLQLQSMYKLTHKSKLVGVDRCFRLIEIADCMVAL